MIILKWDLARHWWITSPQLVDSAQGDLRAITATACMVTSNTTQSQYIQSSWCATASLTALNYLDHLWIEIWQKELCCKRYSNPQPSNITLVILSLQASVAPWCVYAEPKPNNCSLQGPYSGCWQFDIEEQSSIQLLALKLCTNITRNFSSLTMELLFTLHWTMSTESWQRRQN